MAKAAMFGATTNFRTKTSLVPITERDAAESFAAVVIPFEIGDLARASRRTKEAAKMWKAGRRCPNGSSLINMARTIPAVRAWLFAEIDGGAGPEINSPRALTALFSGLQHVASQPGADGDAARQLLSTISNPGAGNGEAR